MPCRAGIGPVSAPLTPVGRRLTLATCGCGCSGPTEVDGDARLSPRDRVVLTALLVRPGDPLSPEQLADALWGEEPPVSWPKVVQGCVSRLRRVLGAEAIATVPAGYRLRPDTVEVDREEFQSLVARGRENAASGAPERAVALFEQALGLWHGRPFTELEEWGPGRLEAARLGELRLAVVEDLLQARLDAGDHRGVAAAATVATGEEPFRERRWAILALAQYRGGRQADALGSIRTARRVLGSELGLDPGSDLVVLEQSILSQDPSLAGERELLEPSAECPWKGLSSYAASDQDAFFGRSAEIAAALARLERHQLLVLTGPSGSGKSSLMLAGLAPALTRRSRTVVAFTPGVDPPVAMATACLGVPGDPVLLVDQFEETFTLAGPDNDPGAWLGELARYAETRASVVVTLRADQMVHLTVEQDFARMAEQGVLLVAPLEGRALREAIEEPARRAGVRLEHGLVDLMIRDTEGQPGALPLLSHALVETWRRREHGAADCRGLSRLGRAPGGRRCLGRPTLREPHRRGAGPAPSAVMLRMVSVSDGGEPVRSLLPAVVGRRGPCPPTGPGPAWRALGSLPRGRTPSSWRTRPSRGRGPVCGPGCPRALRSSSWCATSPRRPRAGTRSAVRTASSTEVQGCRAPLSGWPAPTPTPHPWSASSSPRPRRERTTPGLATERQIRRERQQNRRLRVLLAGVAALLLVAAGVGVVAVDRGRAAQRDRDRAEGATADAIARVAGGPVRGHPGHQPLRSGPARSGGLPGPPGLPAVAVRAPGDVHEHAGVPRPAPHAVPGHPRRRDPRCHSRRDRVGSPALRVVDLDTGELGPEFDHPVKANHNQSVVRVSANGSRVAHLVFDPDKQGDCGDYEALLEDNGRACTPADRLRHRERAGGVRAGPARRSAAGTSRSTGPAGWSPSPAV